MTEPGGAHYMRGRGDSEDGFGFDIPVTCPGEIGDLVRGFRSVEVAERLSIFPPG